MVLGFAPGRITGCRQLRAPLSPEKWGFPPTFCDKTRSRPVFPVHDKPRDGFTALTLAGCILWVLMLGIIRRAVGDNWNDMRHQLAYLDYALVAAALVGAVYLVHRRRRARRLVVA